MAVDPRDYATREALDHARLLALHDEVPELHAAVHPAQNKCRGPEAAPATHRVPAFREVRSITRALDYRIQFLPNVALLPREGRGKIVPPYGEYLASYRGHDVVVVPGPPRVGDRAIVHLCAPGPATRLGVDGHVGAELETVPFHATKVTCYLFVWRVVGEKKWEIKWVDSTRENKRKIKSKEIAVEGLVP